MTNSNARTFERYVAIGDSSTEGLDDPDGSGGYRGWADRLARAIARAQGGSLLYANLGVRGRKTREVLEEQLEPALAMNPDLVTVFSGTNDVIRRHFDRAAFAADVEEMQSRLIRQGATVLTFTLPELEAVLPLARLAVRRLDAMNESLRKISARTGAILVDFTDYPVAGDPRLWSADRLHANSQGHERIAAALSDALGLPGSPSGWSEPLPPRPKRSTLARASSEAAWWGQYFLPWILRHFVGRSSGDGRHPKRPVLSSVDI